MASQLQLSMQLKTSVSIIKSVVNKNGKWYSIKDLWEAIDLKVKYEKPIHKKKNVYQVPISLEKPWLWA